MLYRRPSWRTRGASSRRASRRVRVHAEHQKTANTDSTPSWSPSAGGKPWACGACGSQRIQRPGRSLVSRPALPRSPPLLRRPRSPGWRTCPCTGRGWSVSATRLPPRAQPWARPPRRAPAPPPPPGARALGPAAAARAAVGGIVTGLHHALLCSRCRQARRPAPCTCCRRHEQFILAVCPRRACLGSFSRQARWRGRPCKQTSQGASMTLILDRAAQEQAERVGCPQGLQDVNSVCTAPGVRWCALRAAALGALRMRVQCTSYVAAVYRGRAASAPSPAANMLCACRPSPCSAGRCGVPAATPCACLWAQARGNCAGRPRRRPRRCARAQVAPGAGKGGGSSRRGRRHERRRQPPAHAASLRARPRQVRRRARASPVGLGLLMPLRARARPGQCDGQSARRGRRPGAPSSSSAPQGAACHGSRLHPATSRPRYPVRCHGAVGPMFPTSQ